MLFSSKNSENKPIEKMINEVKIPEFYSNTYDDKINDSNLHNHNEQKEISIDIQNLSSINHLNQIDESENIHQFNKSKFK